MDLPYYREEICVKSDEYEINIPTIKVDNSFEEKNLSAPYSYQS